MTKNNLLYLIALVMMAGLSSAFVVGQDNEVLSPVNSNDEWEVVSQEFNGVEMVLVPPGCFMMGSTDEQIEAAFEVCESRFPGDCRLAGLETESPRHEICFDQAFWIDRYEVSNGQFAMLEGIAEEESTWPGDELPRVRISWYESRDFCELREARLPTEAEWEYAARGPDSLVYPWGNHFDGNRANYCDEACEYDWADTAYWDGFDKTAPVGTYEGGVSWVGAYDMSGNVSELTSTIYGMNFNYQKRTWQQLYDYPYRSDDGREDPDEIEGLFRVIRGGSWKDIEFQLRSADRRNSDPNSALFDVGLRCVRDYN